MRLPTFEQSKDTRLLTTTHAGARARNAAGMDFAALMSKELSKSKKPTAAAAADGDKKYLKRSEIEAQRTSTYLAEQKALETEREAKAAAKRKREDEVAAENAAREEKRRRLADEARRRRELQERDEERARRKRLGLPELNEDTGDGDRDGGDGATAGGAEDLPELELVAQLRALGQPARLFGESHVARLRRYRKFKTVVTNGPIPTTLELVEERDMRVDGTVPRDSEGRQWLFRQLASYFTMVLTEYERAMENERRDTTAGKAAYNAMVQTRENMKPVCRAGTGRGCRFEAPGFSFLSLTSLLTPVAVARSSSANSKPATSTTRSSSPSSKSSKRCRSDATSTQTTATCA